MRLCIEVKKLLIILLALVSCEEETITPLPQLQTNTPDQLSFLALGDSYTIGEGVNPDEKWPEQLVDSLERRNVQISDLQVIAQTGWRTDHLIAAIEGQNPDDEYDLVSLLIGVNNQYQKQPIEQYRNEFQQLLLKAISLTKNNDSERVIVLSIPDYGYTPFGAGNQEEISEEIDAYNSINFQISAAYGVRYVDITDISRRDDPSLVAPDNLHPSARQYSLWVERMLQTSNLITQLQQ